MDFASWSGTGVINRLMRIRDGCTAIATKHGYRISTLSVMLDHLHIALRGDPRQSPQKTAIAFQHDLANLERRALWAESFYVGTFSEYSMKALRRARRGVNSRV